ncbi:hypothetical protein CCZ01_09925, partial [Helicobacter monodelphidis]|uniref:hypothetical protein n=1 Tax=Helicobacter sp. 15-1451 TaxID=2004995 RepID=UPI000DCE7169
LSDVEINFDSGAGTLTNADKFYLVGLGAKNLNIVSKSSGTVESVFDHTGKTNLTLDKGTTTTSGNVGHGNINLTGTTELSIRTNSDWTGTVLADKATLLNIDTTGGYLNLQPGSIAGSVFAKVQTLNVNAIGDFSASNTDFASMSTATIKGVGRVTLGNLNRGDSVTVDATNLIGLLSMGTVTTGNFTLT